MCGGHEHVGQPRLFQHAVASIHLPGSVDPHDLSTDRQFAMNLARGVQVLRAFSAQSALLGNRELSDITGLPKATVSRLTYTLSLLGLLEREAVSQKFRLTAGVLSLGHPLLASMPVRQLARPLMVELAQRSGCTVNLGMRDRSNVVYIDSIRPHDDNAHMPDIGATYPMVASAIGRALIFATPRQEGMALLNFLRVQDGETFAKYASALEEDRKRWEKHGYCHGPGYWRKEVHAIAVPIAQRSGEPALAMNCTLYAHRNAAEYLPKKVVPLLKDAVRHLEAAQGLL